MSKIALLLIASLFVIASSQRHIDINKIWALEVLTSQVWLEWVIKFNKDNKTRISATSEAEYNSRQTIHWFEGIQ